MPVSDDVAARRELQPLPAPAASVAAPAPAPAPPWQIRALAAVRSSVRGRAWIAIAGWWLGSRAVVIVTAIVVQAERWPHGRWVGPLVDRPLALLTAWDGRWYRMVASRGYLAIPRHQSDTAFFPLYPALLRLGHAVGLSLNAAGLIIANAALLVALVALYELVRCWADERTARRAAVYAALFPIGYVFSMVYPEALVLAGMAIASLLATRGRWGGAAIAAALAALTRPEALLLVLPLGVLALRSWPALDARRRWRAATAVLAAPAAVAGICAYEWRAFGDPFAFSSAQRAWGRAFELGGVGRAVRELADSFGTTNVWLLRDAIFCVLYIALLVAAARLVPPAWTVAAALMVLLPIWSGSFTSDARFGVVAPPIFVGLARLGRNRIADIGIRVISVTLLVAATATILLRWP
ncbi:MAG: hypothetical protein ACJ747_12380 [Gaiellaceae bacterium]|jgi:hypothetical protein